MTDIPNAVLSERLAELIDGRRLIAAVFTTYQLDGGFFEQEVLPVLFDIPLSHETTRKLMQLEPALRSVPAGVAVYYDAGGLIAESDFGSPKLGFRRVPVRVNGYVFHPKNLFLLVESPGRGEDAPGRALLVGALSANLTRSGWWSNVEAAHFEEIEAGDFTRLKREVALALRWLRSQSDNPADARPVEAMLAFLKDTDQRETRTTDGKLHTHFYAGREPFVSWLADATRGLLDGLCLEVISPYFDTAEQMCATGGAHRTFQAGRGPRPPAAERARPGPVRSSALRLGPQAGGRLLGPPRYRSVLPARQGWRHLAQVRPRQGLSVLQQEEEDRVPVRRLGQPDHRGAPGAKRGVGLPGRCGAGRRSRLLAHQGAGAAEVLRTVFERTGREPGSGCRHAARAAISLGHGGDRGLTGIEPTARLGCAWPPGRSTSALWLRSSLASGLRFPTRCASALRGVLPESSLVFVKREGASDGVLLVQEDGLAAKPSLLRTLSVAEILRFWALLSPEQRATFIEVRAGELTAYRRRRCAGVALPPTGRERHPLRSIRRLVPRLLRAGEVRRQRRRGGQPRGGGDPSVRQLVRRPAHLAGAAAGD